MKFVSSLFLLTLMATIAVGQVRPIYDQGVLGLAQTFERLSNTKRVMHIGAHPDDEDSALLAYLARKEKARTVYLSLTRGDGGQNVIGPELFEALGIIRTEELLQARTLDGATQMFTSAFDFGYSKTLKESRDFWDEEKIKCEVVKAIRAFRPQVINSRFNGTPRDGHGHHQFSGYITPIAIKDAADPTKCPGTGPAWQISKFYVGQGFRSREEPSLRMNTGTYDPLLGRSYYQIAVQGRSQHKTQEQGRNELLGDRFSGANLISSSVETSKPEKSMFDGIDTSLSSLVSNRVLKNRLRRTEREYVAGVSKVSGIVTQYPMQAVLNAYDRLSRIAKDGRVKPSEKVALEELLSEFQAAILQASGLRIDVLSSDEVVSNGETVGIKVNAFFPKNSEIKIGKFFLKTPAGWEVDDAAKPREDNSRFARFFRETPNASQSFDVTVPASAKPTQPYFLESKRNGNEYKVGRGYDSNDPFQKPLIYGKVEARIDGRDFVFEVPVQYRFADDVRGELRRNLNVVPAASVSMDKSLLVVGEKRPQQQLAVNVVNLSAKPLVGKVRLTGPNGLVIKEPERAVSIAREGRGTTFKFLIDVPDSVPVGDYEVRAVLKVGDREFDQTLRVVAYDHIQTHRYYTPAETKVVDL